MFSQRRGCGPAGAAPPHQDRTRLAKADRERLAEGGGAVVNDRVSSAYAVRQRANLLITSAGVQSTPEMQQRARAQALRDLIDERLQILETSESDIHITPAEIDSRLADIARS